MRLTPRRKKSQPNHERNEVTDTTNQEAAPASFEVINETVKRMVFDMLDEGRPETPEGVAARLQRFAVEASMATNSIVTITEPRIGMFKIEMRAPIEIDTVRANIVVDGKAIDDAVLPVLNTSDDKGADALTAAEVKAFEDGEEQMIDRIVAMFESEAEVCKLTAKMLCSTGQHFEENAHVTLANYHTLAAIRIRSQFGETK